MGDHDFCDTRDAPKVEILKLDLSSKTAIPEDYQGRFSNFSKNIRLTGSDFSTGPHTDSAGGASAVSDRGCWSAAEAVGRACVHAAAV